VLVSCSFMPVYNLGLGDAGWAGDINS
jgi:hypothetical protein